MRKLSWSQIATLTAVVLVVLMFVFCRRVEVRPFRSINATATASASGSDLQPPERQR